MYLHASDKICGEGNFHQRRRQQADPPRFGDQGPEGRAYPAHGLGPVGFRYTKPQGGPLAVGLLGTGRQGQRLLAAVDPAYVTVRSIADLRPSKGKDVRKDVHVYLGYEELLAAAKADGLEAVIIALPSHLHAAAALAALDAGLHVFVEPPMALSVADAKKMAAKAADKKLFLAVGRSGATTGFTIMPWKWSVADLLDQCTTSVRSGTSPGPTRAKLPRRTTRKRRRKHPTNLPSTGGRTFPRAKPRRSSRATAARRN